MVDRITGRKGIAVGNFKETFIWKAAFESEQAKDHRSSVDTLISVFDKARENAGTLVSEIAVDLPGYTVHDIEHLDALWEIGSQIVGQDFHINPVEGFVLGCSFLFHDAAMTMAAYPGGLEEIKASREWKRIYGRMKASHNGCPDEAAIIEVFLREQHAFRAEKLPKISWKGDVGPRFLIDDADSREKFGDFIGEVAASHWWDHSKLESQLQNKIIPAPAPFPSIWSIDLLKLACVLRTADASQIDERRAPSFLRALRQNRLSNYSAQHWTFQSKLTQAQNRSDTLFFAALRPFPKEEANEWWMLHDTLKMIDGELRKTDDLLARCREDGTRFAARRVANIEAPENLRTCIQTDGWHPVDTAFSISDIPRLVENLGGDQLYGHDNMAALREAIQNAMDAVRLRQIVDPDAPEPLVEVDVVRSGDSTILKIRDNGVGMSESSIVGNLLSFGTSGWLADTAIGEYNDNFPLKSHVSGRYGIGFFSVFMLGSKVEIKSRRFDASPDQTNVLSFPEGLNTRPLLCGAEYMDRMTSGGTELIIHLDISKLEEGYWRSENRSRFWADTDGGAGELAESIAKHFPASSVPIKVRNGNQCTYIDGRNWDSEPASTFLQRIEGRTYPGEAGAQFEAAVSLITEKTGETVGRAVLYPDRLAGRFASEDKRVCGAVVAQGAKVCGGSFRGMLQGTPVRAARDFATPLASPDAIQRWATEQARLLKPIVSEDEDQENIAEQVAAIGGDIGELKFCEVGGTYFNRDELQAFLKERDEIWVAFNAAVSNDRPRAKPSSRTDTCVSVACGLRIMIHTPMWANRPPYLREGVELRKIAIEVIRNEFGIAEEVVEKMGKVEDGREVYNAPVPAWQCDDGTIGYVSGEYFKRNMTLQDVDQFFIPRDQRK